MAEDPLLAGRPVPPRPTGPSRTAGSAGSTRAARAVGRADAAAAELRGDLRAEVLPGLTELTELLAQARLRGRAGHPRRPEPYGRCHSPRTGPTGDSLSRPHAGRVREPGTSRRPHSRNRLPAGRTAHPRTPASHSGAALHAVAARRRVAGCVAHAGPALRLESPRAATAARSTEPALAWRPTGPAESSWTGLHAGAAVRAEPTVAAEAALPRHTARPGWPALAARYERASRSDRSAWRARSGVATGGRRNGARRSAGGSRRRTSQRTRARAGSAHVTGPFRRSRRSGVLGHARGARGIRSGGLTVGAREAGVAGVTGTGVLVPARPLRPGFRSGLAWITHATSSTGDNGCCRGPGGSRPLLRLVRRPKSTVRAGERGERVLGEGRPGRSAPRGVGGSSSLGYRSGLSRDRGRATRPGGSRTQLWHISTTYTLKSPHSRYGPAGHPGCPR